MGVHLAFWPSRVPWGTREETREVLEYGNAILQSSEGGDWRRMLKEMRGGLL